MFKVHVDVTLSGMKDKLNQINDHLNYRDTRRMDNVEYHRSSVKRITAKLQLVSLALIDLFCK